MANLSQIKTDSDWGLEASKINQNFNQVNTELTTLKNTTSVRQPLFSSTTEASKYITSPYVGQLVLIGSTIPAPIYRWNGSSWVNTGQTGGSAEVQLSEYYTKEETNKQIENANEDINKQFSELENKLYLFSLQLNKNIGANGLISDWNGRAIVDYFFPITSQPTLSIQGDFIIVARYYGEDKSFLSTSYSSLAKYIKIIIALKTAEVLPLDSPSEASDFDCTFTINGEVSYNIKNGAPPIVSIDSELSETSENPVQNKVIYKALQEINSKLPDSQTPSFSLQLNKNIGADGSISDWNGRAIVDYFFPIDSTPLLYIDNGNILITGRYYRENKSFLSTSYSSLAKYVKILLYLRTAGGAPLDSPSEASDFDCTFTINGEEYTVSNGMLENDGNNQPSANNDNYYSNLIGCFERIVCIANSITAGYTGSEFAGTNIGSNDARVTARNWPAYLKELTGCDIINLGYGSTKTTDWRNSTPETEAQNLYCTLELANIEGTQAYFNMLGWNDNIATGTSADIRTDYNDNALSFYGNYDYIVRRLHEFKPKAHIFVFTLARGKKNSPYNDAIRYIATLYPNYCHCIDYSNDPFFNTEFFNKVADDTHYSPLGYNAFAQLVKSLVSKYIYDNPDKFKGIPYTADENLKGSIDVQGLVLSSANVEIQEIGQYITLVANILPSTATNKNVTWTIISGDSECVNLIPNQSTIYCTIKGVKQGFALVQASSEEGGYKAVCMVSVAQKIVNVTSIKLSNSTLQIPLSEGEKTITATITPSSATNKNVRWSLQSGGDSVATIEATGLTCIITPRGTGNDTIIAVTEDGNKEARCAINVTA